MLSRIYVIPFLTVKYRRKRKPKFNTHQRETLNMFYTINAYPSRKDKEKLGAQLGLTFNQVNDWFAHVRAREKQASTTYEKGKTITTLV